MMLGLERSPPDPPGEHSWFWKEGWRDALAGVRPIVPDVARHLFERSDYFAGYAAGIEDREIYWRKAPRCKTP